MLRRDAIALVLSLSLLGGAAVDGWSVRPPADAAPYHAECVRVAATIPHRIGDWVAKDVEIERDAIALLRPNVVTSRDFTNFVTGRRVSVLFVQVRDTRDVVSHYPPICYPVTRGLEMASTHARDWPLHERIITGTEYEFRSAGFEQGGRIVVQNFILLPNGVIARDMKPVEQQIPLQSRYYGAAQVQVVFDAAIPSEERDAAFAELIGGYAPLIEVVLSGRGASREQ
jgi:hypothetical protein